MVPNASETAVPLPLHRKSNVVRIFSLGRSQPCQRDLMAMLEDCTHQSHKCPQHAPQGSGARGDQDTWLALP